MAPSIDRRTVPIDQIRIFEGSARQHPKRQLNKMIKLLRHFGQIVTLIVDENNNLIDGHLMLDALRRLGATEVSVSVLKEISRAEVIALRLSLNRIAEDTVWDNDKLRVQLQELNELSFDMELTGFDVPEIDHILSIEPIGDDAIEELRASVLMPGKHPMVRLGDVFLLGKHVVCCGDSRDLRLLAKIMNGDVARVVFIDPPYNVPIQGHVSGLGKTQHREFLCASGEMTSDQFTSFLAGALNSVASVAVDGAIVFVCMDFRHISELLSAAAAAALELKNLCVWVKSAPGMGTFYRSQHELVFVFKKGSGPHTNNFELGQHGRSRSNVWRYAGVNTWGKDRMKLLGAHPTVKPLTMVADALKDVSKRGETVVDSFLGSGTTLLAAEKTGRRCVGIELDPGYVEVAIGRWQSLTGRDAILAETGQTFDEVISTRLRQSAEGGEVIPND
ncbi:MAG: hypothetical protein ABS35_26995 [Kaistia sp. SCN 65-12]|nr:MAG: hypothetical protein ABS35_26995 [Kaistia sp. SCN 65-12]